MALAYNIFITCYSIILLSILNIHRFRGNDKKNVSQRLFCALSFVLFFALLADLFSRIHYAIPGMPQLTKEISVFLVFILYLALPSLLLLYLLHQIYRKDKILLSSGIVLLILNLINIFFIISQFTNFFYTLDENGVYSKGQYYHIMIFLVLSIHLTMFFFLLSKKNHFSKNHFLALLSVPVFPIVAGLIQFVLGGCTLVFPSIVISLLVIFIHEQHEQIFNDPITGLNNHRLLMEYLRNKILSYEPSNPFSVIMISVKEFDYINENLGEKQADDLLIHIGDVLKTVFKGENFISRGIGGTFWVVLDEGDAVLVERKIDQIRKSIQSGSSGFDYEIGFGIYYDLDMSIEDFMNDIDRSIKKWHKTR